MSVWYDPRGERWRYKFLWARRRHQGECRDVDGRMARDKSEARAIEQQKRAEARSKITEPRKFCPADLDDAQLASRLDIEAKRRPVYLGDNGALMLEAAKRLRRNREDRHVRLV